MDWACYQINLHIADIKSLRKLQNLLRVRERERKRKRERGREREREREKERMCERESLSKK